jgi:hypothetical protein
LVGPDVSAIRGPYSRGDTRSLVESQTFLSSKPLLLLRPSSPQTKFNPKQEDELHDAQPAYYSKVTGTFRFDIAIKVILAVGELLSSLLKKS